MLTDEDRKTIPGIVFSDVMHHQIGVLQNVAGTLLSMASSFEDVGNEKVAERLAELADRVRKAATHIRDASYERTRKEHDQGVGEMGKVLNAILKMTPERSEELMGKRRDRI